MDPRRIELNRWHSREMGVLMRQLAGRPPNLGFSPRSRMSHG
jgi:hypothetical protein